MGLYPNSVIARDLNGDGKLDIVTADTNNNSVSIALGNGDGTFLARTSVSTGAAPQTVYAADLNGDGVLDIITDDNNNNTASILLGNMNTTYPMVSLTSQTNAQNALGVLDSALRTVNAARSSIGALQSRLDFATSVNMNTIENISAARSQIMDTDMAAETAEFARLQILQKAGIAVLGQANLAAQIALKLLENI